MCNCLLLFLLLRLPHLSPRFGPYGAYLGPPLHPSCPAAGGVAGQAAAALSCWTGAPPGCSPVSVQTASSSAVQFFLSLKKADGTVCSETCATSTTVTATLNGVVATGSCETGVCYFSWSSPTTERAGNLALRATVHGTVISETVVFAPGESP